MDMKAKLFITGLAFMAVSALASAQNPGTQRRNGNGRCNGTGEGAAYVDNNKNGICDNYENRSTNVSGNKGKGSGKCNGKGQGQGKGKGKNFVDANKNGICDNSEASQKK
jgi:hypothetical protein